MENTAGFYKNSTELFYAPNFVYSANYKLKIELKDTYTYPVEGWRYFATRQEALDYHGIQEPIKQETV